MGTCHGLRGPVRDHGQGGDGGCLCHGKATLVRVPGWATPPQIPYYSNTQVCPHSCAARVPPKSGQTYLGRRIPAPAYGMQPDVLRVPPPTHDNQLWWCDDIFIPASDATWSDRLQWAVAAENDMKIWTACYEETPGFRMAMKADATWYLKIPAGELRMRTADSVYQGIEASHGRPATRNPRPIHIGVIARTWTFADHAACRASLEAELTPDCAWLTEERRDHQEPRVPSLHKTVMWQQTPWAPHRIPSSRASHDWMQDHHPEVYAGDAGARRFPSITPELTAWARDCTHTSTEAAGGSHFLPKGYRVLSNLYTTHTRTSTEAKAWLHAVVQAIWTANQAHWVRTCAANVEAITPAGDAPLMEEVNDAIKTGRLQHQATRTRLQTAIARHTDMLQDRARAWRVEREAMIAERRALAREAEANPPADAVEAQGQPRVAAP
jgi:hypothetical protein